MSLVIPPVILQPFAESGDRATIPNSGAGSGRASYDTGFPPITMQAKVSGGIPPDGRDVNGILYDLSAHAAYVQAGQPYFYSSSVSGAIGGYPLGSLLGSSDASTWWLNLLAGNTSDPDASGANWVPAFSYGYTTLSALTGGTRVLTRLEARRNTIVLNGVLTSNLAIVLPLDLRSWRIINNCTGAFTVTARGASGTGVTVPAGGPSASVGVFSDGTNVYLEVPPVSLPISAGPDPNTLIMRTNAGYAFATYFNQNSPLENFAATAVFCEGYNDGYFRKMSPASFAVQIKPTILDNSALTGTPTAPTQAVGNNTTLVANTTYVQNSTLGGVAQSWQNLTGTRVANVVYTNTTGRPIQVVVCYSIANANAGLWVSGVRVAYNSASTGSETMQASVVVPAGATYEVIVSGSVIIQDNWAELR